MARFRERAGHASRPGSSISTLQSSDYTPARSRAAVVDVRKRPVNDLPCPAVSGNPRFLQVHLGRYGIAVAPRSTAESAIH